MKSNGLEFHQWFDRDVTGEAPKVVDIVRQQSPDAARQHCRRDVCVVNLFALARDGRQQLDKMMGNGWTVLGDPITLAELPHIGQQFLHRRDCRHSLAARHCGQIFAENLSADPQFIARFFEFSESPLDCLKQSALAQLSVDENVRVEKNSVSGRHLRRCPPGGR
jgi:hypothetical protein